MKSINWQKLFLELLVVFLGVTGGFILNNFRDTLKDKKLETKYIESFIQNIDANIEEVTSTIKKDSIWLKNMNEKLRLMAIDSLPNDSNAVIAIDIMNVSRLSMRTSTFEDIKFSGNLNIIKDYHLKEDIVEYHNLIDGSQFVDKYYNEYFSNFVMPFIMNKFNLAKNDFFDLNSQVKSQLFNVAGGYFSMRQQRSKNLKDLLTESETMKKKLEDYLNR